jgi:hypothetical protein
MASGTAHASAPSMMLASAAPPSAEAISRSYLLCTPVHSVALSGSYAYAAAAWCDTLVVVDISNPASPVIRGSVVSSSLLNYVRAAWSCGRGWPRTPRHASAPSITPPRPRHHRLLMLSRALTRSPSRAVLTGSRSRRERHVRLRGGASIRLAGGGRY